MKQKSKPKKNRAKRPRKGHAAVDSMTPSDEVDIFESDCENADDEIVAFFKEDIITCK